MKDEISFISYKFDPNGNLKPQTVRIPYGSVVKVDIASVYETGVSSSSLDGTTISQELPCR
jgi:hypothetical protein